MKYAASQQLCRKLVVLHRAAVRSCGRITDFLAGQRFIEGDPHVVGRTRDVVGIRRGFAVDGAFINYFAVGIDDKHVGRVLGAIGLAGLAVRIDEKRGRFRLPFGHLLLGLFGRKISLFPGRGRINAQPDNAFAGKFFLELLHIAAAVMFLHEGAIGIKPFQHDVFPFVLGKRLRFAFRISDGKIGRGAADRR